MRAARRYNRTRGRPAPIRGFSLPELIVVLTVGGVVFGAFALVAVHQERAHAELARRVRARGQMREGLTALAAELRTASPTAGDIPAGGARDSSIEVRATMGTAIVCDVRDRTLVLALASFVAPLEPGDTLWTYVAGDVAGAWTPLTIAGIEALPADVPSSCVLPAAALDVLAAPRSPRPRQAVALSEPAGDSLAEGTPIRVTRRVRYSLYRAPDGNWYLGRREWSAAAGRFETIQPVSGPFRAHARAGSGSSGLELEYHDAHAAEVPSGAQDTERIARVSITLRAPYDARVRGHQDTSLAVISFRNRP